MAFEDMRLVVLGFGYTARAFMRAVRPGSVVGTTRSSERADDLHQWGVRSVLVNGGASPTLAEALREATHVLVSARPSIEGDPFLFDYERDFAAAEGLEWIGYLSTVGVYGGHDGALIDERAICTPTADRGVWRLEAEAAWMALGRRIGVPVAVFRLAGIYGPGRNQLLSLAQGRAKRIVKPGQVFNRIHVDDIATTLLASVRHPVSRIYNVADDEAAPPADVVDYAAHLMGVPAPPEVAYEDAALSAMAQTFYGDTKRVSNARIKDELGVTLRYPTYREGLGALWESGTWRESLLP